MAAIFELGKGVCVNCGYEIWLTHYPQHPKEFFNSYKCSKCDNLFFIKKEIENDGEKHCIEQGAEHECETFISEEDQEEQVVKNEHPDSGVSRDDSSLEDQ